MKNKKQILYTPNFLEHIQDASKYYFNINPKLSIKLKKFIKIALNNIKKNPTFQIRYKNIRCYKIDTFPYMIHYHFDEENNIITILAFISTHLDPNYSWIK